MPEPIQSNAPTPHGAVKTYSEDMAKAIEGNEAGLIKQIIKEEEEKEQVKKNLSPESQRNKTFMLISVVLIFAAFMALGAIVIIGKRMHTVDVTPQFVPLIFTDSMKTLEIAGLNKEKILETIHAGVSGSKVKAGGVEGIYLTEGGKYIGLRRFLSLLKANIDQAKLTYVSDNFFIGAVKDGASENANEPAVLIKTRAFEDIFEPLQAWESKMYQDLHILFGDTINTDTNYLLTKNFEAGVIENKDARILYRTDGTIALFYLFADDTSVIIARSEEAAREIVIRLASSKVKR